MAPPRSWRAFPGAPWTRFAPLGSDGPARRQGWKIHVSATVENVQRIIRQAHAICRENRTCFKSITGWDGYFSLCGKYAARASSGKIITIYPEDDEMFVMLLRHLDDSLGMENGPHILTDVQYGSGPVYFRYGLRRRR